MSVDINVLHVWKSFAYQGGILQVIVKELRAVVIKVKGSRSKNVLHHIARKTVYVQSRS